MAKSQPQTGRRTGGKPKPRAKDPGSAPAPQGGTDRFDPNASAGSAPEDSDLAGLWGISLDVFLAPVGLSRTLDPLHSDSFEGTVAPTVVGRAMAGFFQLDRKELEGLQRDLFEGGFYDDSFYTGKKKPRFGDYDDDSFAAYRSAVIRAARSGKTVQEVIGEGIEAFAPEAGAGRTFVAPTRRPLDQPTLELSITKGFQDTLGRNPTPEELSRFASSFRANEATFFEQQESEARRRFDAGADFAGEVSGSEGVAVGRLTSPTNLTVHELNNTPEARQWRVGIGLYRVLKALESGAI